MPNRSNDRFDIDVARKTASLFLSDNYSVIELKKIAKLFGDPEFCHRIYLLIEDFTYNLEPKTRNQKVDEDAFSQKNILAAIRKRKLSRQAVLNRISSIYHGHLDLDPSDGMEKILSQFFDNASQQQIYQFIGTIGTQDEYLDYIGSRP